MYLSPSIFPILWALDWVHFGRFSFISLFVLLVSYWYVGQRPYLRKVGFSCNFFYSPIYHPPFNSQRLPQFVTKNLGVRVACRFLGISLTFTLVFRFIFFPFIVPSQFVRHLVNMPFFPMAKPRLLPHLAVRIYHPWGVCHHRSYGTYCPSALPLTFPTPPNFWHNV
jgi:hypothetical protein